MMSALRTEARLLASRGSWHEVCALLRNAARSPDAEVRVLLGEALLRTGQPMEAREVLTGLVMDFPALGGDPVMRRGVNLCGAAHFEIGELDEAQAAFARAGELARADGDDLLGAQTSNNMALIANIRGHHEEALALYRLALPAYQRLGSAVGLSQSLHNMAITYRDTAALDAADDHEQRAADCARTAGDERMVAIAMVGRAEIQLLRGDIAMAEATARYAASCFERIPDPARQADALRLAGAALSTGGNGSRGLELLNIAVTMARACGAALIEAESLRSRAEANRWLGDLTFARQDGEEARALFSRLKAHREEAAMRGWLEQLPG